MKKIILLFASCIIALLGVACKKNNAEIKNFENIYLEYCGETASDWGWMGISGDKKTLSLDTKPVDDYLEISFDEEVIDVIYAVHEQFNIPSYVIDLIAETSKADGTQKFENDLILVWWKYSSVKGLEITYELK